LDRGDVLFWLLISIVGIWASVLVGLTLNKELASTYGQLVLVESTLIGIAISGAVFLAYTFWPETPRPTPIQLKAKLPEAVPVASNAEKLRVLSPIHMMIMAIERVSPREASLGPNAGVGTGRFVSRNAIPNLNDVRSVFSKYADVLGDHHMNEWLNLEKQIKEKRDGFWVGRRQWKWFDELEAEYERINLSGARVVSRLRKRRSLRFNT
jgi:hypothetical protein